MKLKEVMKLAVTLRLIEGMARQLAQECKSLVEQIEAIMKEEMKNKNA